MKSFLQSLGVGGPPSIPDPSGGIESPSSTPSSTSPQEALHGREDMSTRPSTASDSERGSGYGSSLGAKSSTEEQLFEAMDRQALRFIEMLNDDTNDEDGHPVYDLTTKMKVFQIGQDWLIRRQKLKPSATETEGSGITDMRSWINDPSVRSELDRLMFESGYVKMPEKKPRGGRPRVEERPVRDRFKQFNEAVEADDDSGWEALGVAPPKGATQ